MPGLCAIPRGAGYEHADVYEAQDEASNAEEARTFLGKERQGEDEEGCKERHRRVENGGCDA